MGLILVIAGWLLAVLLLASFIGSFNVPGLLKLSAGAQRVNGTVVEKHPELHESVRVAYVVNGREYVRDFVFISAPNPPYERLVPGDTVIVHYDPSEPRTASLAEPSARLRSELFAVLVAAVVLGTLVVGSLTLAVIRGRATHA